MIPYYELMGTEPEELPSPLKEQVNEFEGYFDLGLTSLATIALHKVDIGYWETHPIVQYSQIRLALRKMYFRKAIKLCEVAMDLFPKDIRFNLEKLFGHRMLGDNHFVDEVIHGLSKIDRVGAGNLCYNIACAEARFDCTHEAWTDFGRAFSYYPRLKRRAFNDPDFKDFAVLFR